MNIGNKRYSGMQSLILPRIFARKSSWQKVGQELTHENKFGNRADWTGGQKTTFDKVAG